jgi:hypothetical protein
MGAVSDEKKMVFIPIVTIAITLRSLLPTE